MTGSVQRWSRSASRLCAERILQDEKADSSALFMPVDHITDCLGRLTVENGLRYDAKRACYSITRFVRVSCHEQH